MKREWKKLGVPVDPGVLSTQSVEHVLAEYDSPEVMSLLDPQGNRYVAVASDENLDRVRWLQAGITEPEWNALVTGRLTLLAVFLKPTVQVVDRTHEGEIVEGWTVSFDDLDRSRDLPDADAFLPRATLERFRYLVESENPPFGPIVDLPVAVGASAFPRRVA